MTKYISDDPKIQPLHDMMDEIEIAYNKADDAGMDPIKVKMTLLMMSMIYDNKHPQLTKGEGDTLSLLLSVGIMAKQMMENPPPQGEKEE
jgi:hypothetical protein